MIIYTLLTQNVKMQLMLLQLDNTQTLTVFDEQTKAISDGRVTERSERVFTEIFIPCYLVAILAGPKPGSHHVVAYLSMQICGFSWLSYVSGCPASIQWIDLPRPHGQSQSSHP